MTDKEFWDIVESDAFRERFPHSSISPAFGDGRFFEEKALESLLERQRANLTTIPSPSARYYASKQVERTERWLEEVRWINESGSI